MANSFRWHASTLLCNLLASCGGGSTNPPTFNLPPVPVISSPGVGATFKGGETLTVTLIASDPEDGTLPDARLTW
jgi:hypothetical protein